MVSAGGKIDWKGISNDGGIYTLDEDISKDLCERVILEQNPKEVREQVMILCVKSRKAGQHTGAQQPQITSSS